MDLAKDPVPGESGVKEYNGCGLSGFVACELELAEDNGRVECSFNLCFPRDKKLCLCLSFSFSVEVGTKVDVETLALAYSEVEVEAGSTKLLVDEFAKPLRSTCAPIADLLGDCDPGAVFVSLSFDSVIVLGFENSFILELLLFGSLSEGGGT
jgi:hypothetical protein